MNNLFDTLENCIAALQQGETLERVLQGHPESANELRPILEAAIAARQLRGEGPSAATVQRTRTRFLQKAAVLREDSARAQPRAIPLFQRLALAGAATAVFLAAGTGFVRASSGALPGESLYVVKRTWENVRLILVLDTPKRLALSGEFGNERLSEVQLLIEKGQHEEIRFGGVFLDVGGDLYISGIRVVTTHDTVLPTTGLHTGAGVVAVGSTNSQGYVELLSVELLQSGAVVPVGSPVDLASTGNSGQTAPNTGESLGAEAGSSQPDSSDVMPTRFRIEGTVRSLGVDVWIVNNWTVYIGSASIKGKVDIGTRVELEGYFDTESRFIVTSAEVEDGGGKDSAEPGSSDDDGGAAGNDANESADESDDNADDSSDDGGSSGDDGGSSGDDGGSSSDDGGGDRGSDDSSEDSSGSNSGPGGG